RTRSPTAGRSWCTKLMGRLGARRRSEASLTNATRDYISGRLVRPALRELGDVPQPPVEDRLHVRIRLAGLLRLVRDGRRLHEPAHQALERVVRPFELGRVMDGAGRTRLAAEAAVHALRHVDVEAGHDETAGRLVLLGVDHDAIDRARALARETRRADLEV